MYKIWTAITILVSGYYIWVDVYNLGRKLQLCTDFIGNCDVKR